jgi:hypothetical protein
MTADEVHQQMHFSTQGLRLTATSLQRQLKLHCCSHHAENLRIRAMTHIYLSHSLSLRSCCQSMIPRDDKPQKSTHNECFLANPRYHYWAVDSALCNAFTQRSN